MSAPTNHKQLLIFLHIPKAAGMTLHGVIERQYGKDSVLTKNASIEQVTALYDGFDDKSRENLSVIKGHIPFGIHQFLSRPATYITLLRDPVDRILSYYHYVLRSPDNEHYHAVTSQNLSLREYLESGLIGDNGQTRWLSGAIKQKEINECSVTHLEIAKENLRRHFKIVGLLERFDETMILLQMSFSWKSPFYVKRNVTKNRPLKEQIPHDTMELIHEQYSFDLRLYRYAETLMDTHVQQAGSKFVRRLRTFRVLNRGYSMIHPAGRRLKSGVRKFAKKNGSS